MIEKQGLPFSVPTIGIQVTQMQTQLWKSIINEQHSQSSFLVNNASVIIVEQNKSIFLVAYYSEWLITTHNKASLSTTMPSMLPLALDSFLAYKFFQGGRHADWFSHLEHSGLRKPRCRLWIRVQMLSILIEW